MTYKVTNEEKHTEKVDIKKEMAKTLLSIMVISGLLMGEPLEDNRYYQEPSKSKEK